MPNVSLHILVELTVDLDQDLDVADFKKCREYAAESLDLEHGADAGVSPTGHAYSPYSKIKK